VSGKVPVPGNPHQGAWFWKVKCLSPVLSLSLLWNFDEELAVFYPQCDIERLASVQMSLGLIYAAWKFVKDRYLLALSNAPQLALQNFCDYTDRGLLESLLKRRLPGEHNSEDQRGVNDHAAGARQDRPGPRLLLVGDFFDMFHLLICAR
jgi:hypothetical protein